MTELVTTLAAELHLQPGHATAALRLLEEGNTIPFIARYRKELTGSMDEVALSALRDRSRYLAELNERRGTVLETIEAQGKLTPELRAAIQAANTKQVLEDLYLPFRPKRRTRATIAREKGLEPLAQALFIERLPDPDADAAVAAFIAAYDGTITGEEVWAGCRDILAEQASEHTESRTWIRQISWRQGRICAVPTAEFAKRKTKFSDYYAFDEPVARIPAHRYLALRRGEMEKVLRVSIVAPEAEILAHLIGIWCEGTTGRLREQWQLALEDAYRRLIAPSIEVELRVQLKESADGTSITLFAENLRNLLLQPPGSHHVVIGLDPGLRTGTKWAVVDATGRLLEHGTIYPLPPQNQAGQSAHVLTAAIRRHGVEVLALGNGTGSRELLTFVREMLKTNGLSARALLVSEAGASVYSASEIAREEFPELDLTIRGAISIARRWQDPLAELVKIDPKSIGVGQYQHDVNQTHLRQSLDDTVEFCVNRVGVNLNTASWTLLRYVSGLGAAQAREVILFRDARGPFTSRDALQNVPRLGPRAYQQCAGFLRIPGAANPLDGSAVHPEHYPIVERMAEDLQVPLAELVGSEALVGRIDPQAYVNGDTGLPTLEDILSELRKPGRDPREPAEGVHFSDQVTELSDLRPGMQLAGVVTNVTHFGAFVDLGVHQDGLVHISQLADRFVQHPGEVVRVGQVVQVTVLQVDPELKRIALSMKSKPDLGAGRSAPRAPGGPEGQAARKASQRGKGARSHQPAPAERETSGKDGQAPQRGHKPAAELEDVLRRFGVSGKP